MPGFSEDAARRIGRAVRRVEQTAVNTLPDQAGPRIIAYAKVGKLTTGLSARSGSAPGGGTVQPYLMTKGTIATRGPTVTVYNWTGNSVASGKMIKFTVIDGVLFFDGEDCSSLAAP